MNSDIPVYVHALFLLTVVYATYFFNRSTGRNNKPLLIILLWLLMQTVISLTGFYLDERGFPPRFVLLVLPPLILILLLFITPAGRRFTDSLNLSDITYLQAFRFPVEIVLYLLFLSSMVPELMTFEGRNWDILAGITAPVIGYLYFARKAIGRKALLIWNIAGLILLFNIVVNAVLSAPTDFQKFAFDMPNRAVFHFPFVWLPGYLVPLALYCHLASIRQIIKGNADNDDGKD